MPKPSAFVTAREAEIGRRVQRVREHIHWPQPAFAAELDISRDSLASIEYARTPLRYPVAYRLCLLFDIHPAWLAAGLGDMHSTLLLPPLPSPEAFPARSIFSRIYDQTTATKPAPAAKKPAPRAAPNPPPTARLIPNLDPTAHVIRAMTDLLAAEKFPSPLQRQQFALEITSYARDLALRLRRDTTTQRAVAISARRGGPSPRLADLAALPARNAKTISHLRAGLRRLDQEIAKLDAAMRSLDPHALNPYRLPRPEALEVVQLEDAIEKIARQIDEAQKKIGNLISRRPAATG